METRLQVEQEAGVAGKAARDRDGDRVGSAAIFGLGGGDAVRVGADAGDAMGTSAEVVDEVRDWTLSRDDCGPRN